jgi:sugar transferase (PEP-CTERM/EpsH1 system associated)
MKNLLYLVHRLPYPPDKGDKITSYNMLKFLSGKFNVYLGCFVDTPEDRQYLPMVRELCTDLCAVRLHPTLSKLLSLRGLFTGEALSLPYYRNKRLQRWVKETLRKQEIHAILVLSGAMAQYVNRDLQPEMHTVLDLEDVDSDKWNLFARNHGWPLGTILKRESNRLFAFEHAMAKLFDVTLFVSEEEARMFQRMAPDVAHRVHYRVQGVDSSYFDPTGEYPNPYGNRRNVLVFTGAMDYWPNADAVIWFTHEVLPLIKKKIPDAHFCIVGRNPSSRVRALAANPAVTVTGAVPDVRPYLAHASCAALPLRVARGIQNKILEAMAMEKPVLATPEAVHGLDICPGFTSAIADNPSELAAKAIELLTHPVARRPETRECVIRHYDWNRNLQVLHELLDGGQLASGADAAPAAPQEKTDAHSSYR